MNPTKRIRVLIVDDDPDIRRLLKRVLEQEPHLELISASSGEKAIELTEDVRPAIVLLDIGLPGINGYQTCLALKSRKDNRPNVIMVSAKSSQREQEKAFECGADDYLVKPINIPELVSRVRLHLRLRSAVEEAEDAQAEISDRNLRIRNLVSHRMREMIATQEIALFTLAKIVERRDDDTGNHVMRVQAYSLILGEYLAKHSRYSGQIDGAFLDDLRRSSPLHDIGKVGIRDSILMKPGKLTDAEYETMKTHVSLGADLLDEAVGSCEYGGFMKMAATIARYHHERYDGNGYVEGLAGQDIPLPARIVALADVFDALVSERPYKPAYSVFKAKKMIMAESGKQFDPVIVDAFVQSFDDFYSVHKQEPSNHSIPKMNLSELPALAAVVS